MLKAIERAQHLSLTQASYQHRHGIRSAEHRKDQRLFMISNSPMAPRPVARALMARAANMGTCS